MHDNFQLIADYASYVAVPGNQPTTPGHSGLTRVTSWAFPGTATYMDHLHLFATKYLYLFIELLRAIQPTSIRQSTNGLARRPHKKGDCSYKAMNRNTYNNTIIQSCNT